MSVPDLIGRYHLGRRLGSGGFAVVWLAHDESLDTTIAIKVMADNWSDRMDLRERFLTEARMLRRAASSRVVQVFDIGELPDGRPYFVMEYADRGTLADRAAAGPLHLVDALRLTAEVARGAAELHRAGIVHRDLKPSNVLITSTPDGGERLMVADLGVAKNLAQASALTMSVGSAGYMAPEQAGPNSGVDVRADVYSLGAIGFRLITGEHPALPGYVLTDRSAAHLPPPVRRLLQRALEVDRERRWPDAATLALALDDLADEYSRSPQRPQREGRSGRRGRWAIAAACGVVVLLSALGTAGVLQWRKPVTVQDADHRMAVVVPRAWSHELIPTGWNPSVLALSGGHSDGLTVADHVGAWSDLSRPVNGVFAGLTSDPHLPAAVAAIKHKSCSPLTPRAWNRDGWSGRIQRWNCATGTLDEVSLVGPGADPNRVYLQIRQDGGDATDQVLTDLRVG